MGDGTGYSKKNYYMFKDSLYNDCSRFKNRPSWMKVLKYSENYQRKEISASDVWDFKIKIHWR